MYHVIYSSANSKHMESDLVKCHLITCQERGRAQHISKGTFLQRQFFKAMEALGTKVPPQGWYLPSNPKTSGKNLLVHETALTDNLGLKV